MVKSGQIQSELPLKGSSNSLSLSIPSLSLLICLHSCDYCHLIVQLAIPPTTICCNDYEENGKEQAVLSSVCSQTITYVTLETMAEAWRRASELQLVFRWENIFKFRHIHLSPFKN